MGGTLLLGAFPPMVEVFLPGGGVKISGLLLKYLRVALTSVLGIQGLFQQDPESSTSLRYVIHRSRLVAATAFQQHPKLLPHGLLDQERRGGK